jgi:large subunit ribosomal protein L10
VSKEKKVEKIEELQAAVTGSSIGILTDYRGLSTLELTSLRRTLRAAGIEYRVVKNTLARLAVQQAGWEDLSGLFTGPVAVAFGHDEISGPARVLADYIRTNKSELSIKGGFLGDRPLSPEDVKEIANLPSKEVLLAKVLGGMQAPISGLARCLVAPMQGLVGVLQARIDQMEGA